MAAGWSFDGNGDNGGYAKLKDAGGRLRIPGQKAGNGEAIGRLVHVRPAGHRVVLRGGA
jgi:hypothetical protein